MISIKYVNLDSIDDGIADSKLLNNHVASIVSRYMQPIRFLEIADPLILEKMPSNWSHNWKPFVAIVPSQGSICLQLNRSEGFGWIKLKIFDGNNCVKFYEFNNQGQFNLKPGLSSRGSFIQTNRLKRAIRDTDEIVIEWKCDNTDSVHIEVMINNVTIYEIFDFIHLHKKHNSMELAVNRQLESDICIY